VLGVIINDSGSEQDISALMVENATPGVRYMIPSKHSTKVVRFDALHFIQIKSDIKCRAIVTNFTDNKAYPKYFENNIFIPHERTIYIKYYQKGSGAVTLSAMNTYDIKVEIRTLAGTKENVLVDDTIGFTCIASVPDAKITENPQRNGSATSSIEDLTFDVRLIIGQLEVIDPNESAKYQVKIERGNEVKGRFPPAKIPYITVTNTTMNDMYAMLDIKGRRYNHKITPKKNEISINLQLGITKKATNIMINVLMEVVPSIVTFGYATYGTQAVKALYVIKAAKKAQQTAKTLKTFKSGTKLTNLEKLEELIGAADDLENFIGTAGNLTKYRSQATTLKEATGKLDDAKAILTKTKDAAKTAKDSVKKSLQEAAEKADGQAKTALKQAEKNIETANENLGKLKGADDAARKAANDAVKQADDALLEAQKTAAKTTKDLNDDVLDNLAQSKIDADDLKNVTDDVVEAAVKNKNKANTILSNKTDALNEAQGKLDAAKTAGAKQTDIDKAQDALNAAKKEKEAAEKAVKDATDDFDVKNAANAKNKSNLAADAAKTAQKSFDDVNNAAQKEIDDLITKSDDKIKLQEKIDDIEKSEKELADLAENVTKGVDTAIAKSAKLTKQISDNQKNILESFHKIKEYKKLDISAWEKKKQNWWDSYEYIKKAMNPFEWENMKKSTVGQKLAFLFCAAAVVAPLMANNMGDTVETEETTEEDAAAPEAALDPAGEAPAPAPAPTASTETTAPPPPIIRA
jgi:hypothetical protein